MNGIHEAGALEGGIQRCRRCGAILSDYRGAMIPEGDPPLAGWAIGARIEVVDGNPRSSWVTEADPTCAAVKVIKGIGEAWAGYFGNVIPAGAGDVQIEECKRAFYAGGAAMFSAVLGSAELEEDAAGSALEALDRELEDYLRLFKSREGITS